MRKALLMGAVLGGVAFSQNVEWKITATPFVAFWKYDKGVRKSGVSGGLFLSGTYRGYLGIEGQISATKINYKGGLKDWRQTDYIFGVGYYALKPYYLKGVFHHISTNYNDDFSDGANVVSLSGGWYRAFYDNLNVGVSYSFYKKGLRAFELTPSYYRYIPLSGWEGVWLGGGGEWIHLNKPEVLGWSNKNYYSLEVSATYWYSTYFYAGINSFIGNRVLSVEKGGYIVKNLGDKYKGGIELSAGYEFVKNVWVKGSAFYTGQKEADTGETIRSYGGVLSLSYQF